MPVCPAGHDSTTSDFCDTCGMRIEGAGQASAASGGAGPAAPGVSAPAAGGPESGSEAATPAAEPCPQCGTGRSGRFCENCGLDFAAEAPAATTGSATAAGPTPAAQPAPPAPAAAPMTSATPPSASAPVTTPAPSAAPGPSPQPGWTAVVAADRGYFDATMAASGPDAAGIEFPGYCPERRFRLSGPEMRIGRHSASRGIEPEIDLTGPPTDPGVSHLHAVLVLQPDGTWSVIDPGSANGTIVNDTEIATGVAVPLKHGDRICLGAWTVLTILAD